MAVLIISLPMVSAEEYSLIYDANGNLVFDQETDIYREYNELNQLIRTRINNITGTILQEYTWEPLQERIFIKDEFYSNGSLKSSTYYFGQDYIVIQNSSGTFNRTNIYQDGILVGYEDFDGRKRYVLPDHKGSVHLVLNESGEVIEENLFSPFAEPLQGVNINKFGYEAKEYDPLTKDYDFHFRKFSVNGPPILNQPDTLIQNVYDPQSLNRYAFERNNPINKKDDDGHTFFNPTCPLYGCAPEIIIAGTVVLGGTAIYAGTKLREAYPPSQLSADLSSTYDYVYEYAIAGPADRLAVLYNDIKDQLDAIDVIEGIGDLLDIIQGELKEEDEEEELTDGKKIKKDKLPDANELIAKINELEEEKPDYTGNSYNSGGSSGGGGGCVETCSISCSPVHGGGQACFQVCNKC